VRSAVAHGLVRRIDAAAALAVPGVRAVLTAGDLPHEPLRDAVALEGLRKTPQPALAADRVRFTGEALALVLADSRYEAEDGAELVEAALDELPALPDIAAAAAPGAVLLHPELGTNTVFEATRRFGDVAGAFARAAQVVRTRFHAGRATAAPLETRGCAARFEPADGRLTVWSATQSPHLLRRRLAAALGMPDGRIRVLTPDVGGGFGQKIPLHPEEVAVALAARRLGRPVVWVEDRRENLVAATQAKEQHVELEGAFAADGELLGLRARVTGDAGAYSHNTASALIEPYLSAYLMPGVYRVRALELEIRAVLTSKAPVAPYRGVGWTSGHTARELLLDRAARELGLDPAELRRRTMVRAEEFPYESCVGMLYDSGSFQESLDRALELVGYDGFRARQAAARREGRLLGIGISPYVEPTGWGTEGSAQSSWVFASHDAARVAVEPSGEVTVSVGTPPQGQGHATTLAQLVAERLGADPTSVTVVSGDTAATPVSTSGTRASRVAVVTGGAVLQAAEEIRRRLLEVAGALLEADPADLEVVDGGVALRDAPSRRVSLAELAEAAYYRRELREAIPEPDLTASAFHDPRATYSNGCIVALVEVDGETGHVEVERLVAVEDCGTIINPLVVDGQIRGALAQGIGLALLEQVVHDEAGQPLASTFMDYLLPTSAEVSAIEVDHCCSPSPFTPGGIKGMGESGLIASPGAIASAVEDALAPFGARVEELPLTPERVAAMIPE
jgi:carbon-monoxide dehydrogenase large subunit